MAQALRGKNGWLFLAEDKNQVLRQHSGELLFSDAQLVRWRELLESRVHWLGERGISYYHLVIPNKESVYADELPSEIVCGRRPIEQLTDYLSRTSSFSFVYPLPELLAEKERQEVYVRTDTHWNVLGAFIAYHRLAEEINRTVPIRILPPQEVRFFDVSTVGDLGSKLDPPERSTRLIRRVDRHRAQVTHDNGAQGRGRHIVIEAEGAEGPTCLLNGDSFSELLLTFLAESFTRLVFLQRPTFDRELIEREKPDVVINATVERFLIHVPHDDGAPSTDALASQKRLIGRRMSPAEIKKFAAVFRTNLPR